VIVHTIRYLREHALATAALICSVLALAGSSYAAFSVPARSVGTQQLRNGAVTPAKLAFGAKSFGGYVKHWAIVGADGKVVGASSRVRTLALRGDVRISWGDVLPRRCVALATVWQNGFDPAPAQGFATAGIQPGVSASDMPGLTRVTTWNAAGVETAEPFNVVVIC
jgi:hypothetical protein